MKKQNGLIAVAAAAALTAPVYAAELPVAVSGLVEVEAASSEDYAGASTTDIYVATVEMVVDAEVNDKVSAHLAYLYEDGAGTGLDEGYLTLKLNDATSFVAGRTYVPFGDFSSNMVSDPLTLEMAETSEDVLMFAMESGNVSGSIYTFNGDVDEDAEIAKGDNAALSFGANIAFANDNMSVGASYISNLADTDGLEGAAAEAADPAAPGVDSSVAGYGVSFGYTVNNFSVIAEQVTAAEKFTNGDLGALVGNEEQPSATNVEVAFDTGSAVIAAAYQMTEEALFLGMPETATSVAVSFDVMEGAGLGIEYSSKDDYSVADGGTGETETAITANLSVEF